MNRSVKASPEVHFRLASDFGVTVSIDENPFCLESGALFSMACRNNAKRGFLFVSKVLGKHIPCRPHIPFAAGILLGELFLRETYGATFGDYEYGAALEEDGRFYGLFPEERFPLPEPVCFIGFAETATALAQSVYCRFSGETFFFHSTRERIPGLEPLFKFDESHSHAPLHLCYPQLDGFLQKAGRIVLVDDEITTGRSALHFIEALVPATSCRRFTVLSLLDWRSRQDRENFRIRAQELGVEITVLSLLSGGFSCKGLPPEPAEETAEESAEETFPGEKLFLSPFPGGHLPFRREGSAENAAPYLRMTGRFGLSGEDCRPGLLRKLGESLKHRRKGKRTLCLGTGEFMYVPFALSLFMGENIFVQSTTRSPVRSGRAAGYAVASAVAFASFEQRDLLNYLYNLDAGGYDEVFLFLERDLPGRALAPLYTALKDRGVGHISVVVTGPLFYRGAEPAAEPEPLGSYGRDDVVFLLKNLNGRIEEQACAEREELIQGGRHYSEMLPVEYRPSGAYLRLFHESLELFAPELARAVARISEIIYHEKKGSPVLLSLARAGTPIGVLAARYLLFRYGRRIPHYGVSIIRDRGIDEEALFYVLQRHEAASVQFLDGWTGKGVIARQLQRSCAEFREKYGHKLSPELAVAADPGHCTRLYGTREDFLIPSACLNATVSGLVSRTVLREDLIGPGDFHGVRWYREWGGEDLSLLFVEKVCEQFPLLKPEDAAGFLSGESPDNRGRKIIAEMQARYGIDDENLIKPGIGETTRVLLRRVPWRIVVDDKNNRYLRHILLLASERGVPVEEWSGLPYACCGIIKSL